MRPRSRLCRCALAELGDAQRGTELLERAIENDPSNAQACVALGTAQCFFEKMDPAGLEKLQHGMRLSPHDHRLGFWGRSIPWLWRDIGRSKKRTRRSGQPCCRDPQFYVARVVLSVIAAGLGRKDEAVAALNEARRLRPRLSFSDIEFLVGRRAALLARLWVRQ